MIAFLALASLLDHGRVAAQTGRRGRGGSPSQPAAPATAMTESDMDDERARAAFRLGRELYEQGAFDRAAIEFERAYGLSGRGPLLFNAYLAYRDARDDENAARTLRGYLAEVADAPDRALLEARLAALERSIEERREAEARQRAEAEEARRLAEEAARPRERAVPGETWPWVVMGAGGAVLLTGAITGAVALAQRSDLDGRCPIQLCPAGTDVPARQSGIETLAITTDVLLVAGGAVAATGLVLGLVLGPRTETVTLAPPVTAACTGEGCFVAVRGEL